MYVDTHNILGTGVLCFQSVVGEPFGASVLCKVPGFKLTSITVHVLGQVSMKNTVF
jgi:branched-subunit amino acid permease